MTTLHEEGWYADWPAGEQLRPGDRVTLEHVNGIGDQSCFQWVRHRDRTPWLGTALAPVSPGQLVNTRTVDAAPGAYPDTRGGAPATAPSAASAPISPDPSTTTLDPSEALKTPSRPVSGHPDPLTHPIPEPSQPTTP